MRHSVTLYGGLVTCVKSVVPGGLHLLRRYDDARRGRSRETEHRMRVLPTIGPGGSVGESRR
jgi:hypothetical protein